MLQRWMQYFDKISSLSAVGLHGGIRSGKIWLIQESNVVDVNAMIGVVLDVFDNLVGIGLSPVPGNTRRVPNATDITSASFIAVSLHITVRAPRVSIDVVHTARSRLL